MFEQGMLQGKIIAVSGGTKGIGRGIVLAAAEQGAVVFFCGRDEVAAKDIMLQAKQKSGKANFVHVDLKDIKECKQFFHIIEEKYGRLDGFVNYAGVTTMAALEDCEEEVFNDIFQVDIKAAFFCAQGAIKLMKEHGGSLVFFGSPHDEKGERDRAVYACAKAALKVLSTHIDCFYAQYGIRSNYITTGWTPTEGEVALRKSQGMSVEELRSFASKMIPVGRMQEVSDYIPVVLFLLSDYAAMVSGANIRMAGGLYL